MKTMDYPDHALLLVGHGSTENEDSSTPTWQCLQVLRERRLFAEVHACFWKEEPSMREVLSGIHSRQIYIVPLFISHGYFTLDVIPRELELTGPVTRQRMPGRDEDQVLKYCEPVGAHLAMSDLLLRRAQETAPEADPPRTSLLVVGHGTKLNDESRLAVEKQVEKFRAETDYAQVLNTYMEEPPNIEDWADIAEQDTVIVVPFFISDGLHSYQDIPVMLGVEEEVGASASQREVFRNNPYHLRGKTLYYTPAIGSHPQLVEVILDQVADFEKTHGGVGVESVHPAMVET